MDEIPSQKSQSAFARLGRTFLSVSLALAMVLAASLIGVGGAALFIYRQMGNNVSIAKTPPNKNRAAAPDAETPVRPQLSPIRPETGSERHAVIPTVADSTEWHFAEFSDKPRFIDVTYDGGRQHARLKVNTVLSSKSEVAAPASLVSDDASEVGNFNAPLNDPGSRYIMDKDTGRVIGIDGTAAAAREVRRAQPVTATIRGPQPEVRVASPVLQYGRPVFDDDQPVQTATPVDNRFLPSRKALPVNSDDQPDATDDASVAVDAAPAANGTSADPIRPVRRSKPPLQELSPAQYDQIFEQPARTSIFRRDRPVN